MPDLTGDNFNLLGQALIDLQNAATKRPDLLSASQGGPSFGSPDYRAPGDQAIATFLGRVVRPGEGLRGIISRLPSESPDAEGYGGVGALMAGAGPGIRRLGTKTFTDAGPQFRPAGSGVAPLSDTHKLWPALMNTRTGEIANAPKPGAYQHESLYNAFRPGTPLERGFVDPLSGLYFSEKQLADMENEFLRRVKH